MHAYKPPQRFNVDQCGLFYHVMHACALSQPQRCSNIHFQGSDLGAPVARKSTSFHEKRVVRKPKSEFTRVDNSWVCSLFLASYNTDWWLFALKKASFVVRGFSCVFSFAIWVLRWFVSSLNCKLWEVMGEDSILGGENSSRWDGENDQNPTRKHRKSIACHDITGEIRML